MPFLTQITLQTDAERQRTTLQKRLVSRHRVAEAAAAESPPLSPQADAESIARTEAADQAERDALERELTSELSRAEDDSNAYESSLQEILSLSEEAVAKASGSSAEEAVRKAEAEAAQASVVVRMVGRGKVLLFPRREVANGVSCVHTRPQRMYVAFISRDGPPQYPVGGSGQSERVFPLLLLDADE